MRACVRACMRGRVRVCVHAPGLRAQRFTYNAALDAANTMLHAQRCTHMLEALRWMLQRLPPWLFWLTLPVRAER